jgi:hypothetical protein
MAQGWLSITLTEEFLSLSKDGLKDYPCKKTDEKLALALNVE